MVAKGKNESSSEEPIKKDNDDSIDNVVITTHYHFKYTTHKEIPIPDVIESLKATEKLIRRTPVFIEKRFEGCKITETQVFVESLESGSLDLDFIVKFVCRTDERTERAKKIMKELVEEKGMVRDLVALGVGSMLTIGAYQIASSGGNNTPSNTITAYQSVVIQAGQDVGLDEKAMKEVIKKIPDQKSLGKDAFNVLKPATQDKNATIEVPDMPQLSIDRDLIDSVPDHYEAPQPSEKTGKYEHVKVEVDASDRHNNDKGWAGTVPGVVDNRVKFHLDESIDPASLHGKIHFTANVTVIERYVPSKKKYEVKEVLIEDVITDKK